MGDKPAQINSAQDAVQLGDILQIRHVPDGLNLLVVRIHPISTDPMAQEFDLLFPELRFLAVQLEAHVSQFFE